MTALASTDVTVTILSRGYIGRDKVRRCSIAFGDASLTYPSGGIPLPAAATFGLKTISDLVFADLSANGYIYKYDKTNHKLMLYQTATLTPAATTAATSGGTPAGTVAAPVFTGSALGTHVHDLKYIGGITATEPVAIDGGDTLGKNAATDRTVAGADSATKGGVVAITGGTPAGTNSAPAFTGSALATHTHTITGAATTAAPLAESGTGLAPAAQTHYCLAIGR